MSNENSTLVEVYFDDVTVTQTKSNLIQYNEYYPFGQQTAGSWTRGTTLDNNFLANGGSELNKASNLYDLEYRNYDPILGRMNGVDPLAGKLASLTPYNFAFNNPVTFTDPTGAIPPAPADPYAGNSAIRYATEGLDGMCPGQEAIFDPGNTNYGIPPTYWNPAIAGGYGQTGWNGSYSLAAVISQYAPDYGGPIYLGHGVYGTPTQIERAGGADAFVTGSIVNQAWNSTPNDYLRVYSIQGTKLVIMASLDFSPFKDKQFHRPELTAGPGGPNKTVQEVIDDIKSGKTIEQSAAIFFGYMINPSYGPRFLFNAIEKVPMVSLKLPISIEFARKIASWGHDPNNFGNKPGTNNDALRHIIGTFLLAERHGPITANAITNMNEFYGLARHDIPMLKSRLEGRSEWAFQFKDFFYNDLGLSLWGMYKAYQFIKSFKQN